jgi:AcrR family transcriptional regulator
MVTPSSPENLKTREKILETAEMLLRRHGPAKTKVVDIARALGMSHANVYRHFDSKAEMQDIVAERWLLQIAEPLDQIANARGSASERIVKWVEALVAIKRRMIDQDPELFATYNNLAESSRRVIQEHVDHLRSQLCLIVADGVRDGEFKVKDLTKAAKSIHEATSRYHHPFFVTRPEQSSDGASATLKLLIAGLKAGVI